MGNCWFHCRWMEILELCILENRTTHTHTHTHTPHYIVYITHITLHYIFLKTLLQMQTEKLCDGMHYLAEHVIMKCCVKMVDSVLYHTRNEFPKWETSAFCTAGHLFFRSLSTFLRKIWHIISSMLPMTSYVSPYIPSTYDHIFLMQTINVH
jgi:hypothetical protein